MYRQAQSRFQSVDFSFLFDFCQGLKNFRIRSKQFFIIQNLKPLFLHLSDSNGKIIHPALSKFCWSTEYRNGLPANLRPIVRVEKAE